MYVWAGSLVDMLLDSFIYGEVSVTQESPMNNLLNYINCKYSSDCKYPSEGRLWFQLALEECCQK